MSTNRLLTTVGCKALLILSIGVAVPSASRASAQTARPVSIPLPPMGWSSWNSFSNTIDSEIVQSQAKAMIATGMQKAGYQYVNIDEGWWLGARDENGNIVVDPKAWPAMAPGENAGDMTNIVKFIHSLGLKAGIYTDAGRDGCSTVGPDLGPSYPNTGSEGHYEQDFLQFAKWGFDYVKVDWCGGHKEKLDPAVQYAEITRAIALAEAATGQTLYYSICNWGVNSPWTWAPGIGGVPADIWRTSGDIVAPVVAHTKNSGRKASFDGMLSNFDQGVHPEAQHTGFYNDPDMMVIGMPGLTDTQNRVHMALWAMSGAPLIVGADLATLDDATRATFINPAVIAIDQDALGLQAVKVAESGKGLEVWSKPLSTAGQRAVLLLNRNKTAATIAFSWKDLGLIASQATVSNAWTQDSLGSFATSYSTSVPAQDAVLLLVKGAEDAPIRYEAADHEGGELAAGHTATFNGVTANSAVSRVEVAYTNGGTATLLAELRVNGQMPTRIAFPPTGGGTSQGTVVVECLLNQGGARNQLVLSTADHHGPIIASIAVH